MNESDAVSTAVRDFTKEEESLLWALESLPAMPQQKSGAVTPAS